jgi:ATP-binding cassette, subfamily G (WHITE), member 2, SNQ2
MDRLSGSDFYYWQPLRYAFDALMANEFHTINASCSSLVPSGPGYEGAAIANQVCATVGSVPGQVKVNGNSFLELSFGYRYDHLPRVSILCSLAPFP